MSTGDIENIVLTSEHLSVSINHRGGMPEVVSVGPPPGPASVPMDPAVPHGGLDVPVPLGIVAEESVGHAGRPGLVGSRDDGSAWSPRFELVAHEVSADTGRFELVDRVAELELLVRLRVDDVLTVGLTLRNPGATPFQLVRLSPSIPVPPDAVELLTFSGRWCRELQVDHSAFDALHVVENRRGRTSHQRAPAIIATTAGAGEQTGSVWGAQLAWSGNFELAAEVLADGRRHVQLGELLSPGEVVVEPGGEHVAPDVVVAWSDHGLSAMSQAFHRHVRSVMGPMSPRPVVLNTWEAVYFDHDLTTLRELADAAAAVGVERFVLDDGWFGGRRDDTAGLGDWWVSEAVWPSGLGPIIDHVTGLGMDFGLWVEPEMVNPDSELYRAHPDWTLTTAGYEPVLGRQQLVLDFGRPEVREHLFAAVRELLDTYDIRYLKWDMNRDLVQASRHGRPGVHGHVVGLYEVLDGLRCSHPEVEIESCASGGGRADLGVLRRTQRIWTSDCNDAVERQRIQRGFSMLFPPEVMGSHIGPEQAHTTGRRHHLDFRAATALFGHLGIEWNLLRASPEEREAVAAAVALHRRLRPLLHGGAVVRGDHPDPAALVHGVVSEDRRQALFAYVQLTTSASMVPLDARLPGLAADLDYEVRVVDDLGPVRELSRRRPAWMGEPTVSASGSFLAHRGLPMPALVPETVLLLELTAEVGTFGA
ncbi:MAG: alpha-galactosidase [Actinomycetota bacterium]